MYAENMQIKEETVQNLYTFANRKWSKQAFEQVCLFYAQNNSKCSKIFKIR
jgi:hypothetical protein